MNEPQTETPKRAMTMNEAQAILESAHRVRIYRRGSDISEAHWKVGEIVIAEAFYSRKASELVMQETPEYLQTVFEGQEARWTGVFCRSCESFPKKD